MISHQLGTNNWPYFYVLLMVPPWVLLDLLVLTGIKMHKLPNTPWLHDMLWHAWPYLRLGKGHTLSK